jgi:hypothetical protein
VRFHAFFTTADPAMLDTVAADKTLRAHAIIEQVHADLKSSALDHLPSGVTKFRSRPIARQIGMSGTARGHRTSHATKMHCMANAPHRRALVGLAIAAALLSGLGAVPSAQAAADTTGPTITLNQISSYVLGQQTTDTTTESGGNGLWFADGGAYRRFTWTATDPSGICRYTIDEEHTSEGWYYEAVDTVTHSTTGAYTFWADEYDNSDDLSQIRINTYDCAGNVTRVLRPGDYAHVERDYGPTVPSGWTRNSCTCAIGDSMIRTFTQNASLTTVVNGGGTNMHVALIMAKGPGRGKAAIYFDGVYATTVDTYAAVNTNRVVMWDKGLSGTANHTIRVVNLATSGRPRIDIDALLS